MTEAERIAQEEVDAAAALLENDQDPDLQTGKPEVKQVKIGDETYLIDEDGNVVDEGGVPLHNRLREKDKKLAKAHERLVDLENNRQPVRAPNKEDLLDYWRKKYPFATDEQLEMNLELSESMSDVKLQTMLAEYKPLMGKMASSEILDSASSDEFPYLDKYKKEVEKVLSEGYPHLSRMSKEQRKTALENSYAVVEYKHRKEIHQDLVDGKKPKVSKEIAGMVKGSKSAAPVIGSEATAGLNANQLDHAVTLGLKPMTYASLLNNNKVTAKRNGKPEPELVSDPVS